MSIFDFFKQPDIHKGLKEYAEKENAVLLDVRTPQEYAAGHIPGSRTLPLDRLESISDLLPETDTPVFVHCLSGGRSARALAILREMGYHKVSNIGGIGAYKGKLEV